MFFDRFGQAIIGGLDARYDGLGRFIVESFLGLLDILGLSQVDYMGALGVNRGLARVDIRYDHGDCNAYI